MAVNKHFAWQTQLSEEEYAELWKEAIFVFDTNFLLEPYRIAHTSSDELLKVFEHIKDRIWLPDQVHQEFHKRRPGEINRETSSREKAHKAIDKWLIEQDRVTPTTIDTLKAWISAVGRIINSELRPFLGQEVVLSPKDFAAILKEKLDAVDLSHLPQGESDSILEKFASVFENRGLPYNEDNLKTILDECERRYNHLGDKDNEKTENKYGDCLIWKQILDYAKTQGKPIIFITGDTKANWWIRENGESSPRNDLREEFSNIVRREFWMYSIDRFFERTEKYLGISVTQKTIQEVQEGFFIDSRLVSIYPEEPLDRIQGLTMKNYGNGRWKQQIHTRLYEFLHNLDSDLSIVYKTLEDYLNSMFDSKQTYYGEDNPVFNELLHDAEILGEKLQSLNDVVEGMLSMLQKRQS